MSFYIEKIIVTGSGKTDSIIELSNGVNIIYGPSNTGKTYIVKCIDYMFGSEREPIDISTGYQYIKIIVRTQCGTITMSRKIGENKIEVSSNDNNVPSGKYATKASRTNYDKTINSVWLSLIGINDLHLVISNENYKKQILSWRTFSHMFMLTETKIISEYSANGFVPVDIDVTPFDNSKTRKEGVSRTYKGYDGYAPILAYIGTEGYLINAQLREGKQHCQCDTPDFLRETIKLCRQVTNEPLLIRLDSGNDAAENIGILLESGCYFIIKRNLRRESKEVWYEMAKANSQNITAPRDGKTVYVGSDWKEVTYRTTEGNDKTVTIRTDYEIIERTIDKYGQFLLPADLEVNTWWTNTGMEDSEVIQNYHARGDCCSFVPTKTR